VGIAPKGVMHVRLCPTNMQKFAILKISICHISLCSLKVLHSCVLYDADHVPFAIA